MNIVVAIHGLCRRATEWHVTRKEGPCTLSQWGRFHARRGSARSIVPSSLPRCAGAWEGTLLVGRRPHEVRA